MWKNCTKKLKFIEEELINSPGVILSNLTALEYIDVLWVFDRTTYSFEYEAFKVDSARILEMPLSEIKKLKEKGVLFISPEERNLDYVNTELGSYNPYRVNYMLKLKHPFERVEFPRVNYKHSELVATLIEVIMQGISDHFKKSLKLHGLHLEVKDRDIDSLILYRIVNSYKLCNAVGLIEATADYIHIHQYEVEAKNYFYILSRFNKNVLNKGFNVSLSNNSLGKYYEFALETLTCMPYSDIVHFKCSELCKKMEMKNDAGF